MDFLIRNIFESIDLPGALTCYDFYLDPKRDMSFRPWTEIVPDFNYDPKLPFFQVMVPTVETIRQGYCLELLLSKQKPAFFTGVTGIGKSVIIQNVLDTLNKKTGLIPVQIAFSAQTSSSRTQFSIEEKLQKKRRDIYGAPVGKNIAIFVDDINMPSVEVYGAQPPIELLRMLVDKKGFYDRDKLFWKCIEDTTLVCAAGPPGGGRRELTQRFTSRLNMICISAPSKFVMQQIYQSILSEYMKSANYMDVAKNMVQDLASSSIEVYEVICEQLKPTPAKFHYTFNMRDVSKIFQGIMMTRPQSVSSGDALTRLWVHEVCRVFYDRLSNAEDKEWLGRLVTQYAGKYLRAMWEYDDVFVKNKIYWGDALKLDAPVKYYEEIKDIPKLRKTLDNQLENYNLKSSKKMQLVFFEDAIEHLLRISRVLRQPKGYIMLIGVGGSGKGVLTRLASFMQKYEIKELEVKKDPGGDSIKDYLKELLQLTGVDGISTCLILTDTQVANESLLEDINSLLNNGEIPNLFSTEEMDKIINDLRPVVAEQKRDESRGSIYTFFVERVRNNLHISLCMSPAGDALRLRCRKFPSLINCCTLNWFSNWPESALLSVSTKFLGDIDDITPPVRKALAEQCVRIHMMVDEKATELFAELRRKVYITPKSYLDLIKVYIEGLKKKRKQVDDNKDRLVGGIEKLKETNINIAGMKKRLEVLQPKLKEKSEVLEVSQKKVNEEQRIATEKEKLVTIQKDEVNEKATRAKAIADEAEAELNILKPELTAAMSEVRQLDRKSISEIKMFNNPPQLVVMVMESVMLLLEEKTDWNSIRSTLSDSGGFVDRLVNFGEKVVLLPESVIKKLRTNYLSNPEFEPDKVASRSVAAKTIVKWVKAMNNFYDVLKKAEPKRKKYQEEKANLDIANKALSQKVKELDEIKARVAKLRADCEGLQAERNKLADEMALTKRRLSKAEELISLLTDEDERWNNAVATIKNEYDKLIGDVFLAAAFVSYLGPFTGSYREVMISDWFKSITDKVPVSDNFGLISTMGNPIEIRSWQQYGLPTDAVSVENAIITMEAMRYPLMVDPQMQANRWIKQLFKNQGLILMKLSSQDFMRILSNGIRIGKTVMIEDVEETLDPSLDSLLEKQFYKNESGISFVRLDNKDVEFDSNFKLFMTSKLPNPHYMPEVSIKVTVINFTVTFSGLEDQLLGDVVKQEQPEIEEKRDEIIRKLANDKKALTEAEENILKLLTNSTLEQILDEEEAVETLKNAKFTSSEITRRMGESIKIETQINIARDSYRTVAIRGSILYFVIADLINIDSMYQNSLDYIKQVFNAAIVKSAKCETQKERMKVLIDNITKLLYSNISRGLFVAHKTIFSFLICTSIKRKEGSISEQEWNYFIRGVSVYKGETLPNPLPKIISKSGWTLVLTMDRDLPDIFGGLAKDITNNKKEWNGYAISTEIHLEKLPGKWDDKLSAFEKLLLIKVFRPEVLLLGCIDYVKKEIGQYYIEGSAGTIENVYQDSINTSPIIFILSQGADPTIMLLKFAEDHKYREKMVMLSLGQGQGPAAKRLIQAAQVRGDWVLLQNCHLAKSWMRELEQLVEAFKEVKSLHEDFRLFLTSMPAEYFPASILQNGVKLTTEPPRGIKANLKRSYQELTQETFESCKKKSETWRKLLFGLCFFHSVMQERRKFGPLGFNIRYEFNDSDLETSITMLRMLLDEQEGVPWEALNYITGHINYGGRVTDDWDRRCLLSILQIFYTPEILKSEYTFSPSGVYFPPLYDKLDEYRKYIEELPLNDPPEVFGMHDNANITYQLNESATLLQTILKVQPRVATS